MSEPNSASPAIADWPEWLSPEYGAIHTAFENEFKRALDHCYGSADAAGMDWTTEGLFSVAASNVCGLLRRLGCPPPLVGAVERLPMPEPEGEVYTGADCADEARIAWASAAVDLALSEGRSADEVTAEDARRALVVFDSLTAGDVLAGYSYSRDALLRVGEHTPNDPDKDNGPDWLSAADYERIGVDRG